MSSAIEVLKEGLQNEGFVSNATSDGAVIFSKRFKDALGEAIVKMEKQEELKEWLEKEIVKKEYSAKECFDGKDFASEEILQIEINLLNEVLVKLSEGK